MNQYEKCAEYIRHTGIDNVNVLGHSVVIVSPMGHQFHISEDEIEFRAFQFDDELSNEMYYDR